MAWIQWEMITSTLLVHYTKEKKDTKTCNNTKLNPMYRTELVNKSKDTDRIICVNISCKTIICLPSLVLETISRIATLPHIFVDFNACQRRSVTSARQQLEMQRQLFIWKIFNYIKLLPVEHTSSINKPIVSWKWYDAFEQFKLVIAGTKCERDECRKEEREWKRETERIACKCVQLSLNVVAVCVGFASLFKWNFTTEIT